MTLIYHIAEANEFERATRCGTYLPDRFGRDGFIHCSYAEQVQLVAETKFKGRSNLLLLEIDSSRVSSEIIDENLSGGRDLYPHIYGPLPMDAIVSARKISVPE